MRGSVRTLLLIALLATTPSASYGGEALSAQMLKPENMLLAGLPVSKQHSFEEAQSGWRAFAQAECRQRQINYPAVTTLEECDRELNVERIKDLRRQLRWLHGLPGHVK
ncbi:hypothetical protein J3U99_18850 [Brucella pituitosa]|uniref:hypothetical protein n=1 Tax=Brucella pituitosa TaxID=571256 RepID=UPI00200579A1|nr:hypothetical protein [Brucella pituitosa]MCK4206841.1 hypothetical protein [Brucella pituitosa]